MSFTVCVRAPGTFWVLGHLSDDTPAAHEVRIECLECGKMFSSEGTRARHWREAHLGVRPYACRLCHKTFKQTAHLNRHLLYCPQNKR